MEIVLRHGKNGVGRDKQRINTGLKTNASLKTNADMEMNADMQLAVLRNSLDELSDRDLCRLAPPFWRAKGTT